MSRTDMKRPLAVTDLRHSNPLWGKISDKPNPMMGSFWVNLQKLRKWLDDSAMFTADLVAFLDENFYIKDHSKNPGNLSVSALYIKEADIDAVFDPLNISDITWDKVCSCAQRQDTQEDLMKLDQLETRLVLYADREKQLQLTQMLQNQQDSYSSDWVHFHTQMASFWKHAFAVSLNPVNRPYEISEHLPNELLDRIFFANDSNRWNYLTCIRNEFGDRRHLPKRLEQIDRLLQAIEYALTTKKTQQLKGKSVQETISAAIFLIAKIWDPILPETAERDILNSPLTKTFYDKMEDLEKNICLQRDGVSLISYDVSTISKKDAAFFAMLRSSIADILKEWNKLEKMLSACNLKDRPTGLIGLIASPKRPISDADHKEMIRKICEMLGSPETEKQPPKTAEDFPGDVKEQPREEAAGTAGEAAPAPKTEENSQPE